MTNIHLGGAKSISNRFTQFDLLNLTETSVKMLHLSCWFCRREFWSCPTEIRSPRPCRSSASIFNPFAFNAIVCDLRTCLKSSLEKFGNIENFYTAPDW